CWPAAKLVTPGALVKFLAVSGPLLGSLQGLRQIGMITGPALPGLPKWMCAACAGPVNPLALRVYLIVLPLMVTVAEPVALELLFGVSDLPLRVAVNLLPAPMAGTATAANAARAMARIRRMRDLRGRWGLPQRMTLTHHRAFPIGRARRRGASTAARRACPPPSPGPG